jgi:hypothetical protein
MFYRRERVHACSWGVSSYSVIMPISMSLHSPRYILLRTLRSVGLSAIGARPLIMLLLCVWPLKKAQRSHRLMSGRGVKAMVMHGFSERQRSSLQRGSGITCVSRMLPWTSTGSVFNSTVLYWMYVISKSLVVQNSFAEYKNFITYATSLS